MLLLKPAFLLNPFARIPSVHQPFPPPGELTLRQSPSTPLNGNISSGSIKEVIHGHDQLSIHESSSIRHDPRQCLRITDRFRSHQAAAVSSSSKNAVHNRISDVGRSRLTLQIRKRLASLGLRSYLLKLCHDAIAVQGGVSRIGISTERVRVCEENESFVLLPELIDGEISHVIL
jgi:hypothetical protein